ncbi:MAG: (2Fe-2S)-binding protein [Phycisphaeraceae bacterium]
MNPDDHVCLCFHVSQRKIVNYCQREQPPVASLISDCLSAGTGCGWCIPFLKSLHKQCARGDENPDLPFSPEEYARSRMHYRTTGERPSEAEESNEPSDP